METVLAEKLETIISRGVASTRPRDRYDLFTLYHIRKDEIDFDVLREALANTVEKRGSKEAIDIWASQLNSIETDEYQKQLWTRYQRQFKYAQDISFEKSVQIVRELMTTIM